MKAIPLKPEVFAVFTQLLGDRFTVDRVTSLYMESEYCQHDSKKPARQFLYRNMVRLLTSEELVRLKGDRRWPEYQLTEKFRARFTDSYDSQQTSITSPPQLTVSNKDLTDRLHTHKVELLTAIGETEEYEAIFKEFPQLKDQIQGLYDSSRDRCSKILGRIKALENLIISEARLA